MIVSVSAHSALPVPVVSLATSLDAKDSKVSKTTPFKNVFDGLTLFQDLQHEHGAQEEGAAVPNSAHKKEPPADHNSGTEEAVVLQVPIVPKTPSPSLAKPSLILPQTAHAAVGENNASAEDRTAPDAAATLGKQSQPAALRATFAEEVAEPLPTSPRGQSDEKLTVSGLRQTPATPVRYSPAPYQPAAAKAPQDASAATPAPNVAPRAVSAKAAPVATTPAPTKEQTTLPAPFATQSSAKPKAASQPAPIASKPTDARHSFLQPAPPESVSRAPEPIAPESAIVPLRPAPHAALSPQSAVVKPATASAAAPQNGWVTAPRANVKAPAEPSKPLSSSEPARSSAPLNNGFRVSQSPPVGKSSDRAIRPDSKPPQAAPAAPAPVPVPIATPPSPAQSEATSTQPANVTPHDEAREQQKAARPSVMSASAPPVATPISPLTPAPAALDAMNRAPETPSGAAGPQHPALPLTPAPKTPLLPQAENFAFAVRMLGLEGSGRHVSLTQSKTAVTTNEASVPQPTSAVTRPQSSDSQPREPLHGQTSSDSQHETQAAASETERSDAGGHDSSHLVEPQQAPGVTTHWNDAAVFQAPAHGSIEASPEFAQAARPNLPLAAQEAHLLAPELPKSSVSSEILLHLTGNDQSSAAIRVADRAGSVNVSVHTSDPVLRESLRSNLGDLSNQLNSQGWRADVVKSAAVTTHAGAQQDSHAGGERSFGQQYSNGGDRQPQRDRRTNGGQWQQELEQQTTGGDAHPGGNG